MADQVQRVDDHLGVRHILTGRVMWEKFMKLGFTAASFKGYEATLFKKHQSFGSAEQDFEAPVISASKPFDSLASINLKKLKRRFHAQMTSLLEGIFRLTFTQDSTNDEHTQDKPYFQGVLLTFVPFPAISYNEVHLEYKSSKHLVGGSYDIIVGSTMNGKNPIIQIGGDNYAVHLGSLLEAKSTFTRLAPNTSETRSFTEGTTDGKVLIQPMLETMAISQLAHFPDATVPIVNFLGTKLSFRPLLYFKEQDVLLTTPRVLHLRTAHDTIKVLGLVTMFTLMNVHKTDMVQFSTEAIAKFPRSGWKHQLKGGKDSYHTSKLTVQGIRNRYPHVDSEPYIHDSSTSTSTSEDDEDSEEEDRDKRKSPCSSSAKRSKNE